VGIRKAERRLPNGIQLWGLVGTLLRRAPSSSPERLHPGRGQLQHSITESIRRPPSLGSVRRSHEQLAGGNSFPSLRLTPKGEVSSSARGGQGWLQGGEKGHRGLGPGGLPGGRPPFSPSNPDSGESRFARTPFPAESLAAGKLRWGSNSSRCREPVRIRSGGFASFSEGLRSGVFKG